MALIGRLRGSGVLRGSAWWHDFTKVCRGFGFKEDWLDEGAVRKGGDR